MAPAVITRSCSRLLMPCRRRRKTATAPGPGGVDGLLAHPAWGGRGLAYNHCAERLGQPVRPLADLKRPGFISCSNILLAAAALLAGSRVLLASPNWYKPAAAVLKPLAICVRPVNPLRLSPAKQRISRKP